MRKLPSRKIFIICCSAFLGFFLMGCATKRSLPRVPSSDEGVHFFGEEGADTIRVVMVGLVNRPGIYDIPQGTTVAGLIEFAMGRRMSHPGGSHYIIRTNSLGEREQLDFRGRTLTESLEIFQQTIVQDGDYVHTGLVLD